MRYLDPIYWFLRLTLRGFFLVPLGPEEKAFINENLRKHRAVLWINVATGIIIYFGLRQTRPEALNSVITALIAPVMVLGAAWFAITFGGIPQKLITTAITITFWMFSAFTASLSAMIITLCYVTPWLLWPVFIFIYIGTIVGCILYDTADGLKVGLDDALLRHSRAALRFYKEKQGIDLG